jgi:hypothetical protein
VSSPSASDSPPGRSHCFEHERNHVDARFDRLEGRFENLEVRFEKRFDALQHSMIYTLAGILAAFAAVVVTANF